MPDPTIAVAGASVVGSVLSSKAQSKAASSASNAQIAADMEALAQQQAQFDKVQQLLQPFATGGTQAFRRAANLSGVWGAKAQAAEIAAIESGPEYRALVDAGEEAILQNASATGGLRGGNTQAALAEFRRDTLADQIGVQYSRFGGLAGLGQASAAGVGAAAQSFGESAAQRLTSSGAARAGAALAQGQAQSDLFGGIAKAAGTVFANDDLMAKWGF